MGLVGLVAVVVEKLVALGWVRIDTLGILGAVGVLIGLVYWRLTRPGRLELAVLLDERANLRERLSTILALERLDDPFSRQAVAECRQGVLKVKPADHFPLQFPKRFEWAVLIWLVVGVAWVYGPQWDLLGRREQLKQEQARQVAVQQMKTQVQSAVNKVKALSEKIDPNLLSQFPTDAARDLSAKDPQQVRQAAVKQISELQKRVKEAREDSKFKGLEDLQQRLQHLKSPDAGPAKGLAQQLAKGEFGKAAAALEALQKQLADQNLTPEQRRQLGQNLADLARQLEKLAQQQWKMENELKKLGLKPELAKDLKKLEEALKKLPMDAEQRKSLMEMAKANQAACKSCSQMSEALNSAASAMQSGSESPESLAEAKDQLSELESLSQQLEMTQATLADLGKAMRKFGEGNCPNCGGEGCEYCEGGGGKGEWAEGEPESEGSGSGGPGIGRGSVTDVKATDTKSDKTKVQGKSDSGPIIASWYVQGNKVKGESTKTFSQVAGEAAQEAAEAIETQHVPREYQDAVKNYFSQLQKSTEASTTEKGK